MSAHRYFFRFSAREAEVAGREFGSILAPLAGAVRAEAAIVYRAFESAEDGSEFRAVAVRAGRSPRIPELGVTLSSEASLALRRATHAFEAVRSANGPFGDLPEFLQYGAASVLLFPLRAGEKLLGFLSLCGSASFGADAISAAAPFAALAEAVLERGILRNAA